MTDWIEWNGGECPIKSDKTRVEYECQDGYKTTFLGTMCRWSRSFSSRDIIAYRIIEDQEPMAQTREQITAQIEALHKQLDAMPVVKRLWFDGSMAWSQKNTPSNATHYIDIKIINGVIHGVAMKRWINETETR